MHTLKYVWEDVAYEIAAMDWQLDVGSLCNIDQIRLKAVVLGCIHTPNPTSPRRPFVV